MLKSLPKIMQKICFLMIAVIFTGCGTPNVPPNSQAFEVRQNTATFFVDKFGRQYPNQWDANFGTISAYEGYSLELRARNLGSFSSLEKSNSQMLDELEKTIDRSKRIIILIHGYNTSASDAQAAYSKIVNQINITQEDLVINFFWDGLVAKFPIFGDARIWWWATGNSHFAGTKGLRPILSRTLNKDIFLISHSRGAHVVLSALSNPRVDTKFKINTNHAMGREMFDDKSLAHNGNRIHAFLVAPAIGHIDFLDPDPNSKSLRPLGSQLRSLIHTVNPHDETLKKFIGGISDNFNPTEFGYDESLANELRTFYPHLKTIHIKSLHSHSFEKYIATEEFRSVLKIFGLLKI